MNSLVFDRQKEARSLWESIFGEFGIRAEYFEQFSDDKLKLHSNPRILVLDQSVIGNDIETAITICNKFSLDVPVITGANISVPETVRLMKNGAVWVFSKELNAQLVRAAVPSIQECCSRLAAQIAELCRLQSLLNQISPRERSVLELVLEGVPNKLIAKELEVSVRTVESRRAKIYRKCEVNTVTELVRCVDRAQQLRGRFSDCTSQAVDQ